MKNYKSFLSVILLGIITGCNNYSNHYKIEYDEISGCTDELIEIYSTDDYKVYTECLENVKIEIDGTFVDLQTSLDKYDITMEEITNKMTLYSQYSDGGSKLHKSDNYNILNCNAIIDTITENDVTSSIYNTDFIIGDTDLEIGYCR